MRFTLPSNNEIHYKKNIKTKYTISLYLLNQSVFEQCLYTSSGQLNCAMCSSRCNKNCTPLNNHLHNRDCNTICDKSKYTLNVCCHIHIDRELNFHYTGLLAETELPEKQESSSFKSK